MLIESFEISSIRKRAWLSFLIEHRLPSFEQLVFNLSLIIYGMFSNFIVWTAVSIPVWIQNIFHSNLHELEGMIHWYVAFFVAIDGNNFYLLLIIVSDIMYNLNKRFLKFHFIPKDFCFASWLYGSLKLLFMRYNLHGNP